MNHIKYNLFPNGKHFALTMSFDDGRVTDRPLIDLFNRYGIKGTFHLNSGFLSHDDFITKEEVKTLYQGHEVALHTVTHPHLTQVSPSTALNEIIEDKKQLEALCGYPIRGMSYPFGDYNPSIITLLQQCGIEYARTVKATNGFGLPEHFLEWHPTIHLKKPEPELWNQFLLNRFEEMRIMYVWGHSYEFRDHQTWDMIESFCQQAAACPDIWFATNIEIKSYIDALRQLVISADNNMIYNPSASNVYVSVNHQPVCIQSKELKILS